MSPSGYRPATGHVFCPQQVYVCLWAQNGVRQNKQLKIKNADGKLMKKFLLAVKFLKWIDSGVARLEIILILVLWMVFKTGGLLMAWWWGE